MNKKEASKLPKFTPNSLLADLPAYLKDPANYNKIQKVLLETLAGPHSHSELQGWHNCLTCQSKMAGFREMMNKLGFKSSKVYMAWKKIMSQMISPKRIKLR